MARKAHDETQPALAELARGYEAARSHVDVAHLRMRGIAASAHAPAQAREAARELTTALSGATEIATQALHAAARIGPAPAHRRHADRAVPMAVRPWAAELVRLAEIGVWLRRTTLDDDGVHLPRTVRVSDYAAKGPHIAGIDFGNQPAASPDGPRIGIDFALAIDSTAPARAATAAAATAA
jgi:hypothetical protein